MSKRQDFSQEQSTKDDSIRLSDYNLGQTIGQGEFGKVKIGWKKGSSATVAVKIIRREKLDTAGRLAKVHREISILKQLDHPNIVSLHEMIETKNTIGMVLEYASGGELFDYILQQRYLKDDKARRLFAQLVSGVGYLHRNGIIHRDLKLENLLLDSNRNIIITDFGFANTFDPTGGSDTDDSHKVYSMKWGQIVDMDKLALPSHNGYKHSDMMSTSCGSPCYAAPELVVSDGLYSGKKVDVWSCGVILYAMLAGYLPFDDDPDNPEGDNINLLYKYICSTPLIFPDYVTPHARDILKRILVPDPNKRADLFEVARHSWLSDYAHLVEAITSNVKLSPEEYHRTKALQIPVYEFTHPRGKVEPFMMARANSERFNYKPRQTSDDLGTTEHKTPGEQPKQDRAVASPKDQKRRTVQVEYVAPRTHQRDDDAIDETPERISEALKETSPNLMSRPPTTKGQVANGDAGAMPPAKDLPPPSLNANKIRQKVPRSTSEQLSTPQSRINPTNLVYDGFRPDSVPQQGAPRSDGTRPKSARLPPSRGSYGKPSSAEVQKTSAQGQISAPTAKERTPSGHLIMPPSVESTSRDQKPPARGHKRASTLSGLSEKILTRANSIGRRGAKNQVKTDRSHPPTSMRHDVEDPAEPRKSHESGRRSFGVSRKSSDINTLKQEKRSSRRFSLLPRSKGSDNVSPYIHQPVQIQSLPGIRKPGHYDGGEEVGQPAPAAGTEKLLPGKHKRFNDAYDTKNASSGASKRVMDFFRRRR